MVAALCPASLRPPPVSLQPFIAVALAVALATPCAPAQPTPTATQHDVARIVRLREAAFPERRALLDQLRALVLSGAGAAATAPVIDALRDGSWASQARLRRWLTERGGHLDRSYWVIPAAAVRLPASRLDELTHMRDVAAMQLDATYSANIKVATDALNSNSDPVQTVHGEEGAGANLALIDSGIDLDFAGTGAPNPAFDRRAPLTGTRIAQAVGIVSAADVEDVSGHGTSVAGVALALDWNGAFGFSDDGFAPAAGLHSYKVTTGTGTNVQESDVVLAWQRVLADAATHGIGVALHAYDGDPDPTSAAQAALDSAAFYGDVLVVTSAGNDGQGPAPAANSQANVSGIAVGASIPDGGQAGAHAVMSFSSYGPLPGEGARYFPDLVAAGSVVSVLIDAPNGNSFNPGTSSSAPLVGGTALLMPRANPSLSALDTKALILNNVEDIAAQNAGLSRFHHGLGLLRADLAFDAAAAGPPLQGQLDLSQQITRVGFVVAVQAGKDYAATLAWPHPRPGTLDWDNLDLEVSDPTGAVIALANTPRNLYERVLFTAQATGNYTIEVIGTSMTSTSALPFSLCFGENHGGGAQTGSYDLFDPPCGAAGASCTGSAADPAAGMIVPAAASSGFANERTRVPFSDLPTRLQQAYPGQDITAPVTVERIAFRRDEQQWGSPGFDVSLEMFLGYTTANPGALDPVFQNNIAGQMTAVTAARVVRFPGSSGLPAGADQFDFSIPLDAPFLVSTSASSHLLMELRVTGHTMGSAPFDLFFDAVEDPSVGRVYNSGQATGTSGSVDNLAIVASLMSAGGASIAPNLQADGVPQLGQTFSVVLRHGAPASPAVLVHGGSMTSWVGVSLPLNLGFLGAPECCILTDSLINLATVVDQDGVAEVPYSIPSNSVFTGLTFYNQFILLDPAANSLGLTTSNGGKALIGG